MAELDLEAARANFPEDHYCPTLPGQRCNTCAGLALLAEVERLRRLHAAERSYRVALDSAGPWRPLPADDSEIGRARAALVAAGGDP